MISFADNTLVYTATNSYGARLKGKAICHEYDHKWSRDYMKELLVVLEKTENTLDKFNDCRKNGGDAQACAGSSIALKYSGTRPVDVDALQKESARSLGFD